mgnify:CR=1 FL=1
MMMTKLKHQKVRHQKVILIHRITISPLGKRPKQTTDCALSEDLGGHSSTTQNSKNVGQKLGLLCLVFHQMTISLDVMFVQRLVGNEMRKIILKYQFT